MARKPWARRGIAAVSLFIIAGGFGCNPLTLTQLLRSGDARLPSQFSFYEKAKTAKKKKDIKIAVLSYRGPSLSPDFIGTERTLTNMFVNSLKGAFEANKEHVTIVPLSEVQKFKQKHDDWKAMELSEVAKDLGVDYVVYIELAQLSLYEPGSKDLFRGHCKIPIQIADADKDAPELFPPYDGFDIDYPGSGQLLQAGLDLSPEKFQMKFFAKISIELTKLFTGIRPENDMRN